MSPIQVEFSASYDRTTKIVSAVVVVFLLAVGFVPHSVFVGGLSVAVLILAFAYSPRGYLISEQAVIVRRLIGNVRLPLEGVREARRTTADDFRGCMRLWGSGGLFGYYGLFRTSKLGKCSWYVTNRRNTVVLVTGAKTALFSPDDVDGFLAAIGTEVPFSRGPTESLTEKSRSFAGLGSVGTWVGVAIGVLGVVLAALAFLYSPGPPAYTLTREALTIHDRFYPVTIPAVDVDVAQIRVIDLSTEGDWRPTMRTNGFANSHYRSGWFRVANGQKIRLYQASGRRLLLLPPKGNGAAVLVEVPEPERFVKELQSMWARE